MADNIECETCGGTDFYKESGYFYCNECQTQSQEVRDHEFQEVFNIKGSRSRKIKQPSTDKSENKLTSWECYNIVMSSLTQELINLGANKNLRPVVKCLWMRYLEKLEVFHLDYDAPPKLPLVNSKRDARIIYMQTEKNKKRKKSTSDESFISFDPTSRKRMKKKKGYLKAQYEELSKISKQESASLNNETLTSLKSSSEKSEKVERMGFNRYSSKELRKTISHGHCIKHKLDTVQRLKCHKLTYKNASRTYLNSMHFVSPLRLYCILYLGLLIIKDKIQLGDLFRFIREGHLTFNSYTHLFSENYSRKFLNIQNNNKNRMFQNKVFRTTTATLATFLDVTQYIEVVDLTQLCQRFCVEMNLPDEICMAVINFISRTNPKLNFTRKAKIIPNYEGRAVSIILFTLKLLFGLDGVTEFKLSKYAQLINNLNINKPKMFNIVKWMEYIGYRNLVICDNHFPYSYMKDSEEIDSDLFLQYVASRKIQEVDENIKLTKEMSDYKQALTKIKEAQDEVEFLEFSPSLTPFLDYAKVLSSTKRSLSNDVLMESFQENSLDFLLRPNKYLQLVGENVALKHGGANDNWIMERLKSYRNTKLMEDCDLKLIPVEVLKNGHEKDIDEILFKTLSKRSKKEYDAKYEQAKYEECRQDIFDKNELYVKKISRTVDLNKNDAEVNNYYNIHYNPYERYWLYVQMNIDELSITDAKQFFDKYPHTFKLIFNECARMVEQTERELLYEFLFSEMFLVFSATYSNNKNRENVNKKKKLLRDKLDYYVGQAEAFW